MTKMQTVAKAVLTFIGLSAINNLCQYQRVLAPTVLYEDTSIFLIVLFFSVFLIVTIAIAYLFIFKNDWLAYKLAGPGEKLDHERETLWIVYALRIVAVLYGLILLADSMPTILNIVVSPLYICHLVNEILTFKTFPQSLNFTTSQWSFMIYNFLKIILAVYLLYGWPQFIRFQLNIRKNKSSLSNI
jgi:hypothetical protein